MYSVGRATRYPADFTVYGDGRLAVPYEARIEAGSAHVYGDEIAEAVNAAEKETSHRSSPAGPDSSVFTAKRLVISGDMTPPLDCMIKRLPLNPAIEESLLSLLNVSRQDGPDIGVESNRTVPFVHANLRQDLAGQGNVCFRQSLSQHGTQEFFILGIEKGKERAHTYSFVPVVLHLADNGLEVVDVKGRDHITLTVNAFIYGKDVSAFHDRRRRIVPAVILPVAEASAHVEHVTEPLGRDKCRFPRRFASVRHWW